jgi:hypothetical protein
LSTKETHTPYISESEDDFGCDDRIALVLSGEPFLSVRQIVKKVTMSKSTASRDLAKTVRWKLQHLKWVLHSVTKSGEMHLVQGAADVLQHLQSIKHQGWQHIVALDESWFDWEIN